MSATDNIKLIRVVGRLYRVLRNGRVEGDVEWREKGGHGGAHWLATSILIDGPRYYHTRADAIRKVLSS